jgi:hypothetical protein
MNKLFFYLLNNQDWSLSRFFIHNRRQNLMILPSSIAPG